MNNLRENYLYGWLIFMLWPFGSFFYSLSDFFNKHNQKIILAFSFLYGYSVFLESGDIIRYEQTFYEVVSYTWNDFIYLLTHFMSPDKYSNYEINAANSKPDIYALILNFAISRFTDNPRWFWAFASLIYTSLLINFANTILKETNWIKNYFPQKIFFIGLLLVIPFYYGVIGIRFWPGLFIFLNFGLLFLNEKKLKYFILAASSILFHYSFLLPIILLIIVLFIPKNRFFYKILIMFGLIVFSLGSVSSSLNLIKDSTSAVEETNIDESVNKYTDEEVLNERKEKGRQNNWYVSLKGNMLMYFLIIIGLLDVLGIIKFKDNEFLQKTYPLFVLFLLLVLLTKDLGSISRFKNIFYVLILSRYTILSGIQPLDFKIKIISYFFTPIFVFYCIVVFRGGFYTVEPLLLINNAITMFFVHSDISLSEFIVGH